MPNTPDQLGALFPEVLAPNRAEVSPQKYRRGYVPKTYSADDVREARRVIAHWNDTFRGVAGGRRANRNDAINVKVYVRFLKQCRDSDGEFPYTGDDVCRAITAYRNCPQNVKVRAWKRFRDWIDVENVAHHIGTAKVEQHTAEHQSAAKAEADRKARWCAKLIRHEGLVDAAVAAAKAKQSLAQFCKDLLKSADDERAKRWPSWTLGLIYAMNADDDKKARYRRRAEVVYRDAYARPPGLDPHGLARINGIALALLAIERCKAEHLNGGRVNVQV